MRGAPAEGTGAGIKDALGAGLAIAALLRLVGIMPDKEIPAQGRIFRGQRVKSWDVAIFGQTGRADLPVIVAPLEQDHLHACLGEACGYCAASRPGANDRIVASDGVL